MNATYSIPDAVRLARAKRRWSQKKLSIEAGVARSTVNRLEHGGPCDLNTLDKILSALDLTISLL